MKRFVKIVWTVKGSLFFAMLFIVLSLNNVFANSDGNCKRTYKEIYSLILNRGIENIKVGLESENDGLRMVSVDQVGLFKITQLEEDVIKLFNKEQSIINKKNIAVTLYQLGTYKTLIKLEEFAKESDDSEISEFCKWLLNEYNRVENINWKNTIKIEQIWAVDTPNSLMYREKK